MAEIKTNAMRILDRAKIDYSPCFYPCDGQVDGVHVAQVCGIPMEKCFKTLVTFFKEGNGKTEYFVFVIPVNKELDLKAAAKSVGVKRVEMLAVKDLLKTTGYIRGGCSPVGMKKKYPTYIDETCILFDEIAVSAGIRGEQIILNPQDLIQYTEATEADVTKNMD